MIENIIIVKDRKTDKRYIFGYYHYKHELIIRENKDCPFNTFNLIFKVAVDREVCMQVEDADGIARVGESISEKHWDIALQIDKATLEYFGPETPKDKEIIEL